MTLSLSSRPRAGRVLSKTPGIETSLDAAGKRVPALSLGRWDGLIRPGWDF